VRSKDKSTLSDALATVEPEDLIRL